MPNDTDYLEQALVLGFLYRVSAVVLGLFLLFWGEPDLHDAVIYMLMGRF